MPIIQCPSCGKKLNLKEPQPGKKSRCPGCREVFVPALAGKSGAAAKRQRPTAIENFGAPKRSGAKAGGKIKKKSGSTKKSKLPLFVGAGILGVALAGGLIYMLMLGSDKANDANVANVDDAMDSEAGMAAMDEPAGMLAQAPVAPNDNNGPGNNALGKNGLGNNADSGDSINLKWLPGNSEAVVFIDMEKLLSGPVGQLIQNPLIQPQIQEMQQKSGLALSDVRSVTLGIGGISESVASGQPPISGKQPVLAVVRVRKTIDRAKLQTAIPGAQFAGTVDKQQLRIPGDPPVTLWLADTTTMVIGPDDVVALAKTAGSTPFGIDGPSLKSGSGIHFAFMPSNPDQVFRRNPPIPDHPDVTKQPLIDFLNAVRPTIMAMTLDVELGNDIMVAGTIRSNGPSGAQSTTAAMQKLVEWIKQMQNSEAAGQVPAVMMMAMDSGKAVMESFQAQTQGDISQFTMTAAGAGQQIAAFAPMMLPAIMQARTAARRTMSRNHLKQIALAMHNFHATYHRFPNAVGKSPSGEKWLSWRVHLLPFLNQQELYAKFALEEPWDSPTNRPLADQMPEVYQSATATLESGRTLFQLPIGPGTIFEDSTGRGLRDITDGSSNTILAVEVAPDRAVYWTQPDDLAFDPASPADGLGGVEPGGFQAVLADGSVRFISTNLSSSILKALFTRNGGEVVSGAF